MTNPENLEHKDAVANIKKVLEDRKEHGNFSKEVKMEIDNIGSGGQNPQPLLDTTVSAAQPQGGQLVSCKYRVGGVDHCVNNVTLFECTTTLHGVSVNMCADLQPYNV
jgi:hypothetical protein